MTQWSVLGYGEGGSVRVLRLVGERWFWTVIDTK